MMRSSQRHLRLRRFMPRSLLHPSAALLVFLLLFGIASMGLSWFGFMFELLFFGGLILSCIGLLVLLLFLSDLESFRHILRHAGRVHHSELGGDFNEALLGSSVRSASLRDTRNMLGLVRSLLSELSRQRGLGESKLATIISAIPHAVMVVGVQGMVSFANGRAYGLLGESRVGVGTSIFTIFVRKRYDEVIVGMDESGCAYEGSLPTVFGVEQFVRMVRLPEGCGGVLIFFKDSGEDSGDDSGDGSGDGSGVSSDILSYDLSLLSIPRSVELLSSDTSLEDVPFAILDTETTGLRVLEDSIISFASVTMQGRDIFPHLNTDVLIDPEVSIPESSRRVHGISDSMVLGAGNFALHWLEIESALSDRVVVGHNIAFDISFLHRQARSCGVEWRPKFYLDTCLLAGALNPDLRTLELDDIAEYYHIAVMGRHTALGDALVTASLMSSLVTEMLEHGVETLGDAFELQLRMGDMINVQKSASWYVWQDRF